MQASFVGDKRVDPQNIPEANTKKVPDEELDKREAQRIKEGAKEPGMNKAAGAASRNPDGQCQLSLSASTAVTPYVDYDTSSRSGQGNTQPQKGELFRGYVPPFLLYSGNLVQRSCDLIHEPFIFCGANMSQYIQLHSIYVRCPWKLAMTSCLSPNITYHIRLPLSALALAHPSQKCLPSCQALLILRDQGTRLTSFPLVPYIIPRISESDLKAKRT